MPPIFQTPVALAICILLRFLLLRQMAFTVCNYAAHVRKVIFIVVGGVLLRVLLQDLDYLAAAVW